MMKKSLSLSYKVFFVLLFLLAGKVFGQATLPLTRTAWATAPTGWTDNGTQRTTIYACSGNDGGSMQATGKYYKVNFSGTPDKLSYSIKASGSLGAGTFSVQESINGTTWSNVKTYTGTTPTTCTTENLQLLSTSRFVQFIYTNRTAQNVDIDDVSITASTNTITTSTISGSPFCVTPTTGTAVSVPYTINGTFNSGNNFTAQLSDATGSFVSSTNIGTLSNTTSAGTISATIPANTPYGTGYRIRVVSSSPVINGSDNGTDLSIVLAKNSIAPTTTQNIFTGANGTTLTVTDQGATSRVWKYATTSGGTYNTISGQTGTSYTPNFATVGNYYVVCESTFSCGTVISNEVIVNVTAPSLVVTVSPTSLTGFSYVFGSGPSTEKSFTVGGSYLDGDITLTAPTNYEISTTSGTGFTNSIVLTRASGSVATTTIYVRLKSGLSIGAYNSENIVISTLNATNQNVICSGNVLPVPTITTTPTSLSGFTYVVGSGPSAEQTFTVSGTNLLGNLVLTAPTNYQISTTTGAGFGTTVTLTPTSGTVNNTTIYVRLKAALGVNSYNENISITSTSATTQNFACSGNVTGLPNVTLDVTSVSGFNYVVGTGPSSPKSFTVSGSNLSGDIILNAPTDYEISFNIGGVFSPSVILSPTLGTVNSTTIYVRLKTGLNVGYYNLENLQVTSTGTTAQNVSLNGTVSSTNTYSGIVISQVYGAGGNGGAVYKNDYIELFNRSSSAITLSGAYIWYTSNTGSFTVGNSHSLPKITLQPGQYYLVQEAAGAGNGVVLPTADHVPASPLSMGAIAGKVALTSDNVAPTSSTDTNVLDFVGFGTATMFEGSGPTAAPSTTLADFRLNNGCTDSNDNKNDFELLTPLARNSSSPFNVCGAKISVKPSTLTGFNYIVGTGPSAEQTFVVNGNNVGSTVTLTAPTNYEISTVSGGTFGGTITLNTTNNSLGNTTIYVRLKSGLAVGDYNNESITASGTGTSTTVSCSGTVIQPTVNVTPASLSLFTYPFGQGPSAGQSVSVSGTNLAGNIVVTAPTNWEISTTATFTTPLTTITLNKNASNAVTATTIYARLISGLAQGDYTGNLVVSSPSAASVTIALTGKVTAPVVDMIVEGNTGTFPNISDGSTTPIATNNTLFGTTNIGGTIVKSFRIRNLGGSPLTIGTISFTGVAAADFSVTSAPTLTTINQGEISTFSVTFSPTALGVRTATINIANNDSDNNPYDFVVQGTGTCNTASTITPYPNSGPANTKVKITISPTAGLNLTDATATLNGTALVTENIDANNIYVTIASGTVSGNIIVTAASGCTVSAAFTVLNNQITTCDNLIATTTPTELFMSEITDSNIGGLTYIEIYNGTGVTKNLSNYKIDFYNNGSSTISNSLTLNNVNLPSGSLYVVAVGVASSCPGDGSLAAQSSGIGGINFDVNGNDYIGFYKISTASYIDNFGVYQDKNWAGTLVGTKGATFRRKTNASALPTTAFNFNDWNVVDFPDSGTCADNDYSDIGTYNFASPNPPTVTVQPNFVPSCDAITLSVAGQEGVAGGKSLTYQWFVLVPNSSTWSLLSDGGVYSGATTNNLTISSSAGLNNYQYYCQVRENDATCYKASNAVLIKDPETQWNGTLWSNGIPASHSRVVIKGNYDTAVNGAMNICTLTIDTGGNLTIKKDYPVTVQNEVKNNLTSDKLTVESDANLVQVNDDAANSGSITVLRNAEIPSTQYMYWSSPVNFDSGNMMNIYANIPRALYYNEATAYFYNSSGANIPGRGLALKGPSTGSSSVVAQFKGKPFNGLVEIPITYSGALYGFNLVGNPYSSNIDLSALHSINTNKIETTFQFWDNTNNEEFKQLGTGYNGNAYAKYNVASGTPTPAAAAINNPLKFPSKFVVVGQGFMVRALSTISSTDKKLVFRNVIRKTDQGVFFNRGSQEASDEGKFWLRLVTPKNVGNVIAITYSNGATNGFEDFDSRQNNATDMFYSIADNEKLAIQGRQFPFIKTDKVPLGSKQFEAGTHKIEMVRTEGIFQNGQNVYLKDYQTGIVTNLSEGSYSFEANSGETTERFEIVYEPESILSTGGNVKNELLVYKDGTDFVVRTQNKKITDIEVFDSSGRLINQSNVNAEKFVIDANNWTGGIYFLKIKIGNETFTKKVLR